MVRKQNQLETAPPPAASLYRTGSARLLN